MKVKKFRIKPRLSSVGRLLKAQLSVKQLPDGLEETLPSESEQFLKHACPTAFYTTWSNEEIPASFRQALADKNGSSAVAVSVVLATVGHGVEDYLSQLLMDGQSIRSQVVTALAEESADLSFNFIERLLAEDAEHDDCDVSEAFFVKEPELLADLLLKIEADQENITLDAAGHLSPRFTRAALLAWLPINKKKRNAAPQQKRSS